MRCLYRERLVAGTVFWRSFESGLLLSGVSPAVYLIWVVAVLATPGYLLAFSVGINLGGSDPATLLDRLLAPTLLLIVLSMAAMVIVALLVWESVYPDKRDVRILGVIGLKPRVLVLGRIGAVTAVATLVAVGMNLPSSVVFGLVLLTYDAASDPMRAILGHFMSTVGSGLFAFFAVLTLQGALLSLLGAATARRAALVMQAAIVVALVQAVQHVPTVADEMRLAFIGESGPATIFFPPTWFLALHSIVVGRPSPPPMYYAGWAIGATVFTMVLSLLFLTIGHARMARMALEASATYKPQVPVLTRFLDAVLSLLGPRERGIAAFTFQTLMRSRPHLLVLAACGGLAFTLASAALVAADRTALRPSAVLLTVPLAVTFILLCCGRILFVLPVDPRAGLVFRVVADNRNLSALASGARAALLLLAVLPAVAIGTATVWRWGPVVTFGHAAFVFVMGSLLTDVMLVRYRSIPFTSTYRPGGARIESKWPALALAFSLYCYSLASLEAWLNSRPVLWGVFVGTALVASLCLARLRRLDLAPPRELDYDSPDPDRMFGGFGLSEALAARRDQSDSAPTPTHHN